MANQKKYSVAKVESAEVGKLLDLIEDLLNGLADTAEIVSTAQVTEMRAPRIATSRQVDIVYVQYFIIKNAGTSRLAVVNK